jgi:hypothetical protein
MVHERWLKRPLESEQASAGSLDFTENLNPMIMPLISPTENRGHNDNDKPVREEHDRRITGLKILLAFTVDREKID